MDDGITLEELQLSARNHGLPLEILREPITPVGLHYLLIHFDIPVVDAGSWRLQVGGLVERPLELTLDELRARPARTMPVTLECAGNGRVLMPPRALSQPWLTEAVGTAEWTGTPLAPILEEAGIGADALEVVFTGLDRGIQGGVEHDYERSLALDDALRDEVLLAYAMNGESLPVQHGYPLRVIVPGWYGMTHVKWLRSDHGRLGAVRRAGSSGAALPPPSLGGRSRRAGDEDRCRASLFAPPGFPDFFDAEPALAARAAALLEGRAWSGSGPIVRVEVEHRRRRRRGRMRELGDEAPEFAWRGWTFEWDATPGEHELACRATDAAGNTSRRASSGTPAAMQQRAAARARARQLTASAITNTAKATLMTPFIVKNAASRRRRSFARTSECS